MHTRTLDPENIGVAFGILSLRALELEICMGAISLPPLPANAAKNCCRENNNNNNNNNKRISLNVT